MKPVALRRLPGALMLLLAILPVPDPWGAAATEWDAVQDLEAIRQVARSFVAATEAAEGETPQVRIGSLDPRLRLRACTDPLEAFSVSRAARGNALTVGVRCTRPTPWTVYVSARVVYTGPVVVAARSLSRGTVLTERDLRIVHKDVGTGSAGALRSPAEALGKRLRRPVAAGRVLTDTVLEAVPVIRRGQQVELVAGVGPLTVRMTGRALSDGAAGQRIRVRNLNSRKVVEGIVDPAGFVRTD